MDLGLIRLPEFLWYPSKPFVHIRHSPLFRQECLTTERYNDNIHSGLKLIWPGGGCSKSWIEPLSALWQSSKLLPIASMALPCRKLPIKWTWQKQCFAIVHTLLELNYISTVENNDKNTAWGSRLLRSGWSMLTIKASFSSVLFISLRWLKIQQDCLSWHIERLQCGLSL